MVVKRLSFFCFLLSILTYGQEFTVSGKVADKEKAAVTYANVVLSFEDSANVSGVITNDDGNFILKNIKAGTYVLRISYLGFRTYIKSIIVNEDINLGVIELEESTEELKGVTVIAKRPTIKRLVDRVVFNVENSTLSDNNVLDVLKYTPGVLVNDEKISVKGSTPTVYINDRKVHLSTSEILQLLEGSSANNIKSIEVITNPPARYEAEGGAVINIVTKKNIVSGYNGSVFGNYKQGSQFPKYAFGTSHFFKTKKLSTYLNYNINPRKDYKNNTEFINFIDNNNEVVSSWESNYDNIKKSSNQNINASIDYEINKNNTLSFSTNALIAPRENSKGRINSLTEVYDSNFVLDSTFNSVNKSVNEVFNFAFTLDYKHTFKSTGEVLSATAHHTNYDFSNFQNVETGYFLPNEVMSFRDNKFQTFSSQVIKLHTGQIDYQLPINESAQFEAGLKVSNINSESIIRQSIFENDIKQDDLQNSDTFLYDEFNYAAYSSYSKETNTWSLKAGLRVEYTDITGNSISTNQDNAQEYLKFFPSLHVLNKFNERNELYFEYNRRIYRPRYEELNPFKFFINDNVYTSGDPRLKPQIDDVFTMGYTFNKKYTFELYYRYENDPTLEIIFQDNDDNIIKYINTNIDTSISYGLDFTTSTQIVNRWDIYMLSSLFYYENQFIALESSNAMAVTDKWSVFAEINNYFTFLKDQTLTTDVSFLYISPIADGPSIVSDRLSLDINLRKTLWDGNGSISIGVADIFNTKNYDQTTRYLNQDVFINSRLENRLFTLGFNYKFGNTKLKNNLKEIELEERNRLNSKKENN